MNIWSVNMIMEFSKTSRKYLQNYTASQSIGCSLRLEPQDNEWPTAGKQFSIGFRFPLTEFDKIT
jgi:hypothetical protein